MSFFRFRHQPLYLFSLTIFFWSIFDGIISYLTPLFFVQNGLSKTSMGLVIASSSVFGAGFDFILSKYLKSVHFRRLYLLMFALCFGYPLFLYQSKTTGLYLILMAVWGLYYDLFHFGSYDFVSRQTAETEHTSSFGVISVFKSLGYLLGPIFAGLVIGKIISWPPFFLSWIFLLLALFIFIFLLFVIKKHGPIISGSFPKTTTSFLFELKLWQKVGRILLPVLIFTTMLNISDAFFWTIGPLFAEQLAGLHPLGGLFISFNMLPPLVVGWFVGGLTNRFGKKKTAYLFFLAGSLVLTMIVLFNHPVWVLLVVFISSFLSSVSWPAIKGAFADYVSETQKLDKEIEGVADFSVNLGYVAGPVCAGLLADKFGNQNAFAILGIIGVIVVCVLLKITPKEIKI